MTALPKSKMTVDEFLAWSQTVPGRYELVDGTAYRMQSERVRHVRVKSRVYRALESALEATNAADGCEALADGALVRIDEATAYEPDSVIHCGTPIDGDALEVPNPVVVVEVLSPSTGGTDTGRKFLDYFKLSSVQHYIIVDPKQPPLIHHARQTDGTILTKLVATGTMNMTPPGITVDVAQFFERT
jgi:Uma2 family endonuclease